MSHPLAKILIVAAAGVAAGVAYWYAIKSQGQGPVPQKLAPPAQPAAPPKQEIVPPSALRSNQLLMRDKLAYATKALEGLSMEDYGKIAEAGDFMYMISRAASWHVIPTERYAQISRNFQEQALDLKRHAQAKNLDAAALDYTRITQTCVQCHSYMREVRAKKD
jgi:hypothetical protein